MYSSGKVVGGTVRQVTIGAQVRRCYVRIRNRSGTGGHERSRHVTDVGSIYEPGWERPLGLIWYWPRRFQIFSALQLSLVTTEAQRAKAPLLKI